MRLFKLSSGCKMHRDPTAGKCKFLAMGRWKGTLTQEDLPCNFFSLSDHLDMLGVTLMATHTATRKANGDELQERIKNVIGPWRAGRFMPLTMRPYSINCYAFSKLWHKCCTIDLMVMDIKAINKQVKGWLYADMLEKPEELAMFRQPRDGGLGLYHVQLRALANQVNCFLETACNPLFMRNMLHQALFQYYILDEDIPKPDIPPYFRGEFFPTIRRLNATPPSLYKMSVNEIYRFLREELTMSDTSQVLTPLRIELASPTVEWDRTWELARQHMLGPELYSFLFKLLHQILPTAERVSRILPNSSPLCTRCQANENETLEHAFFSCRATQTSSSVLLQGLKQFIPTLTASDILTLNFNSEEELNFPLVWCAATFLSSLWKLRTEKKTVELFKIRSELEANCRMLRESRLEVTSSMLSQIF